jgi:hypothetical protein
MNDIQWLDPANEQIKVPIGPGLFLLNCHSCGWPVLRKTSAKESTHQPGASSEKHVYARSEWVCNRCGAVMVRFIESWTYNYVNRTAFQRQWAGSTREMPEALAC